MQKTWFGKDNTQITLLNQVFISAMQNNKQPNLVAHNVEYCITDSPILMSALYRPKKYYKHFLPLLKEINDSYDNINYFLERDFDYVQKGRNKNEKGSYKIVEAYSQVYG